jgi:signal transduction histidine kinase
MAAHAARVTSDLRQARERLVSAREEERRRLRRDLHDGLGPRLASQTLTLDVIARRIHSDPQNAEALLKVLSTQTQQSVAEIRELINGLRPPALDDLGLAVALQELAGELTQATAKPHISVQAIGDLDDLPAAVEVAVYRIAQEALTNVVKHAQASKCQLIIRVETRPADGTSSTGGKPSRVLILEVWDDGRGISPNTSNGVGLGSMEERAAEVGGGLKIESVANRATTLRVEIPVTRGGTVW